MIKASKSILAKLLANENIRVEHGNYSTASFDVVNRVLRLPLWKYENKGLLDMLIAHEVGHAIATPAEGWHSCEEDLPGIPRSYVNVIEDIRIEKIIMRMYPGLVLSFKQGYTYLADSDFFGIANKDLSTLPFMDRLNIKAKLRDLVDVPFSAAEMPFYALAMSVETWDDVIKVCELLLEFAKEQAESKNEETNISMPSDEPADSGSESEDKETIESSSSKAEHADDKDDDQGSKSPTAVSGGAAEKENKNEVVEDYTRILTDESHRSNEEKLLDVDEFGNQPKITNGLTAEQMELITVKYEDVRKARLDRQELYEAASIETWRDQESYKNFLSETKKVTAVMAKEFEMRKAAYQYSRSQTSRSGSINVNKLYSYKYSDDIFKRVTQLADAKSHGMIMLVDYSGSMGGVIGSIIKQILNLTMFCKKVNIPFEVYGFTTGSASKDLTWVTCQPNSIDVNNVRVMELINSSMSKSEYEEAYETMYYQAISFGYGNPFCGTYDNLSGTPLNEVLSGWNHIITKFKRKYAIQKIINVILTDGEAAPLHVNSPIADAAAPRTKGFAINVDGRLLKSSNSRGTTKAFVNNFKNYDCISIGYFLAESSYEFNGAIGQSTGIWDKAYFAQMRKLVLKNRFASFDNVNGYDRYFILRSDSRSLNTDNDEFEVRDNAKSSEIANAFKKYANSKKTNRVLATQFAQTIA